MFRSNDDNKFIKSYHFVKNGNILWHAAHALFPTFGDCKGASHHFCKLSISLFILWKTISVSFNTASVYLQATMQDGFVVNTIMRFKLFHLASCVCIQYNNDILVT